MFTPLITHNSDGTALAAPVDAARRNGATYKTRTIDDLRIKDDRLRAAIEGTGHLLFDGGMGTYYKGAPGRECEQANRLDPEGIRAVHRAYLAAGADAIKTNTFGLPRMAAAQDPEWEALADAGWKLAAEAAAGTDAAVFADLGPAPVSYTHLTLPTT